MATVEERVSLLTLHISIEGSGAWLHLGAFTSTHPKTPSIISISHHSLHPARSSNLREPFLTHLSNRTLTDPNTVRIVIPAPLCALVLRPETLSNPRHPLFLLEACVLPPPRLFLLLPNPWLFFLTRSLSPIPSSILNTVSIPWFSLLLLPFPAKLHHLSSPTKSKGIEPTPHPSLIFLWHTYILSKPLLLASLVSRALLDSGDFGFRLDYFAYSRPTEIDRYTLPIVLPHSIAS